MLSDRWARYIIHDRRLLFSCEWSHESPVQTPWHVVGRICFCMLEHQQWSSAYLNSTAPVGSSTAHALVDATRTTFREQWIGNSIAEIGRMRRPELIFPLRSRCMPMIAWALPRIFIFRIMLGGIFSIKEWSQQPLEKITMICGGSKVEDLVRWPNW